MLKLAPFIIWILTGCTPATVGNPTDDVVPVPNFVLKGLRIGMSLKDAQSQRIVNECSSSGNSVSANSEEETCQLVTPRLGEVELAPFMTHVIFANKKLDWMYFSFGNMEFSKASDALRSAYGQPCRNEEGLLQNGFGANFPRQVVVWCFVEGELHLDSKTERNIGLSEVSFYRKRPPEIKKEYTPNTL